MRILKYLIPTVFIVSLFSCATNSKLDLFFQSKRYKETVKDRDALMIEARQLKKDTTQMGVKFRELKKDTTELGIQLRRSIKDYAELQEIHRDLISKSGTKLAQLSEDLQLKSRELEAKENILRDREVRLREMESMISKQDSITNRLNQIVKNALLGFKADELSVEMKNGKVYVSMTDKLLFKSGSAAVEDKGKQAIRQLSEVLNKNGEIDIAIEGHTDNIPIKTSLYKDNWDLSVVRATTIVRMLSEEYKVDPKRLTASGKGEYFPVASNDDVEGRARNRRTEIILSPKLDELFNLLQKN